MLELTVLLISITVILLIVYFKDNMTIEEHEPFQNFYLSACPSGYKSFYNNNGDSTCCAGEIIANKCLSDNQCTLNGKGTVDTPNCTELLKRIYLKKSKEFCMPSLPNYFEDNSKKIKGCMSGLLNDTMTGPLKYTQNKCVIYDSFDKNTNSLDSCANQKLLDLTKCFGNSCTKELIQFSPKAAPLISIRFTDNKGMPHSAYTKKSLQQYFSVIWPGTSENEISNYLSNKIFVAEVAKGYYIDKTIDKKDIEL